MRSFSQVWVVLLLSVLIGSSCNPDDDDPVASAIPITLPGTMQPYMFFDLSSYWIYEEQTSGVIDSVYVTISTAARDTLYYSNGAFHSVYDYYLIRAESSLSGEVSEYRVLGAEMVFDEAVYPDTVFYMYRKDWTAAGDYNGQTIAMFYPFDSQHSVVPYSQPGVITLPEQYDSLLVQGEYFYQVKAFHDSMNSTEANEETKFFFALNKGIIRKEKPNLGEVWDLIRYNLVQ
jgi:hypothetical protein